jgi:hypothetical protein
MDIFSYIRNEEKLCNAEILAAFVQYKKPFLPLAKTTILSN